MPNVHVFISVDVSVSTEDKEFEAAQGKKGNSVSQLYMYNRKVQEVKEAL